jgi:hypothetical protein
MVATGAIGLGAVALILVIAWETGALRGRARHRETYVAPSVDDGDQCVALTADGQRCIRAKATGQTRYCWQHQRMAQRKHNKLPGNRTLLGVGARRDRG